MNKKKTLIISSIMLVIVIVTLFVSYGFITAAISGNETSKKLVLNGQIIKVEYSDGTENLTSNQGVFTPGSTITKTFTIKNTGNVPINFSINLKNVVNEFKRINDINYELYLDESLINNGEFLTTDGVIAYNQTIEVDEILNYTLKIKYLNSKENQIVDQGKKLNAKIDFVLQEKSISNIKILGKSYQEIINDDPTTPDIDETSPSPTNPSLVYSAGDVTENLFDMKKLLDMDFIYKETDDSYYSKSEESIVGKVIYEVPDGESAVPLKIMVQMKHISKQGIVFQIFYENGNSEFLKVNNSIDDWEISNYTTTYPVKSIKLAYINADVITYLKNVMITKNTELTEYEPYGKYKLPLVVSYPNLFDKSKSTHESIKNDTEGNFWGVIMDSDNINKMFFPGNTYNITYTFKGVSTPNNATINDSTLGLKLITDKDTFSNISLGVIEKQILNGEEVSFNYTFTIPDNFYEGNYSLAAYGNNYSSSDGTEVLPSTILKDINIIEGTISGFKQNIIIDEPFRGTGSYSDTIDLLSGTMYRYIEKRILNTSIREEVLKYNEQYGLVTYETGGITFLNILNKKPSALNTHFKLDTATWGKIAANTFQHPSNYFSVRSFMIAKVKNTDAINITDTASFRTWLDNEEALGRPVTLYYVLAKPSEPVSIELPNLAQISPNATIRVDTSIEAEVEIELDVK